PRSAPCWRSPRRCPRRAASDSAGSSPPGRSVPARGSGRHRHPDAKRSFSLAYCVPSGRKSRPMASAAPQIPSGGEQITVGSDGRLDVPDHPVIPFIEGDGTGPDIWRASVRVLDAAVNKEFGGKKKIAWAEVYAGEKAKKLFDSWLPDETLEAFKKYFVGIKGPL